MTPAPTLHTERLTLRGPEVADFEELALFFEDAPRAHGFGGALPRHEAWRWFASMIGHWHLHGYGYWTVFLKDDDRPQGIVGLWNPEGWPEPELGWVMYAHAEGKGLAYEAAMAVRDYAYETLGWTTLTSNILPGNTRSEALAERMGAVFEKTYENISMGTDQLFRHPGPEALA